MRRPSPLFATLLVIAAACGSDPAPPPSQGGDVSDAVAHDDASPATDTAEDGAEVVTTDSGGDVAPSPTPLGLPMGVDGVTWVGVASIDITPEVLETFSDLDGDAEFDGCIDDPKAEKPGCAEPFDDVNGNGRFDAVWIGGFGPKRAAAGVHDPLSVRTMVVVRNGEYLVLTGLDLVGLLQFRIDEAAAVLAAEDGMDPDRFIASTSHVHQGPDTIGIWGLVDLDNGQLEPGFDPAYQARVVQAMVASVRAAAAAVRPAEVVMGMRDLAEVSPWFNGAHFGGTNPKARVHGLTHDGRDPVVASTRVFAMHARDPETHEGIATLLNYSGHPEVWGSSNRLISADWVGVAREQLEDALGGTAVFVPECLGGMQSMLGAPTPLVDEDGQWVMTTDAGGEPEPTWAPSDTWEITFSAGVHVADAALSALAGAEPVTLEPFEVRVAPMRVHVDNMAWGFVALSGLIDGEVEQLIQDPEACPGHDPTDPFDLGCLDTRTWRLRLGPLSVMTAPGELLPEVFHGLPTDDPRWQAESADPTQRGTTEGRDSVYFPQHPPECDAVDYEACRLELAVGDCDCLRMHDVPYHHAPDPASTPPLVQLLPDTPYRLVIGNAGDYLSYIIPENDFNLKVSLLSGPDRDHYEETVSASSTLATQLQKAQAALGDESP